MPVQTGHWGFVSVAPTSEILASEHSLRDTLILIAVIIVIAVPGILAFVATKPRSRPRTLRHAAQQISHR